MGKIVHLTPGRIEFAAGQRLVKAADFQTYLDASKAIADAEREAERIREAAREDRARERQRGYDDGLRQAKVEMAGKIEGTVIAVESYYASVESAMVSLVKNAVRKIIGKLDDDELIVRVVRNALSLVRNQARVSLHVAPPQEETVRNGMDKLLAGLPGISFVDVVPDGRVSVGSCVLKSDMGIIEASLDAQIEALESSLARHRKLSANAAREDKPADDKE